MLQVQERNRVRAIAAAGMFVAVNSIISQYKTNRRTWVKEYRRRYSHLSLINELRDSYPDDYKNYLRMDSASFDILLDLIKDKISKADTVMRKSISSEERLTATLRFLATGRSFEDLKFSTGISAPSVCMYYNSLYYNRNILFIVIVLAVVNS